MDIVRWSRLRTPVVLPKPVPLEDFEHRKGIGNGTKGKFGQEGTKHWTEEHKSNFRLSSGAQPTPDKPPPADLPPRDVSAVFTAVLLSDSCCCRVHDILTQSICHIRFPQKPVPSPLQRSTAASPPASPGPTQSDFPPTFHNPFQAASIPRIVTTTAPDRSTPTAFFDSESSGRDTPEETRPGCVDSVPCVLAFSVGD